MHVYENVIVHIKEYVKIWKTLFVKKNRTQLCMQMVDSDNFLVSRHKLAKVCFVEIKYRNYYSYLKILINFAVFLNSSTASLIIERGSFTFYSYLYQGLLTIFFFDFSLHFYHWIVFFFLRLPECRWF